MKGTSDIHARGERLIGACITVSIAALAMKGRQNRKIFFTFKCIYPYFVRIRSSLRAPNLPAFRSFSSRSVTSFGV